ncbi:phenylalanine--tRNA ligase subunit beta [Sporomusa malonica]|uniref:Phenylalanine--tRNA ligase beta subunit n=1 Tax=Sporomusa malonica TaxID=112901 RepID=A0A1W2DAK8_9FIRM|nr:phenylalanine--tRNA ligase subunit beta [Sporomusa malonica]SMC94530.1 phenylalanyl-tRNA synthetase beta subunit [Sporomusa malonica]
MRASIKWLKDYVEINETPEKLADMLTMAGIPVAAVETLGKNISGVVTGRVIEIGPHPDADKLSVCKIDIGTEVLTIVTGATNVRQGHIVPVATVGAELPSGMSIQPTKLRGMLSSGMLCSTEELNIDNKLVSSEARNGIYILPNDTEVGIDIRTALGLDDVVLEFELTANRADCFSIIGIAREIAVLTGAVLKKPMLSLKEAGTEKATSLTNIQITDPSLCPRFAARMLTNIKVGPSPAWMQQRIQAAGMRPINNVVDVTNFVMLELGQPMHAYDYNLLARHSLVVRKPNPGEKLTTLDGVKRELEPDMLVIADAVQAVGIAGVMGGLATEVTGSTQNVLLEAASFKGVSIRRTSRALGLRSEASGRFERGVDTANVIKALDRAAKLLEDMGACQVCPGIVDVYPDMQLPRQVAFTPEQINKYLGTDIPASTMIDILKRLEFDVDAGAEQITVTVPTWRGDVTMPADICEEIARIYGYNNVPSTTPAGCMAQGKQSNTQTIVDKIKALLTGSGFSEIISFSFSHPDALDKLNIPEGSTLRRTIEVLNPITDDFPILRTTLLGGVMDTIARNLSRKNEEFKLYELGSVYLPKELPLKELPDEPLMLCGALIGKRHTLAWNQTRDTVDFYDAKGSVEVVLEGLGINDYIVEAASNVSLHPGKTAAIKKDGDLLGVVGEVHPEVLNSYEINRKVYLFELNVEALVKHAAAKPSYQALPKFPAITRDLALVLSENVPAGAVTQAIIENAGPLLTAVQLFDVYTGQQVTAGSRSLAFSLTFRANDRTLTDVVIDEHYRNIIVYLEKTFAAKLRE